MMLNGLQTSSKTPPLDTATTKFSSVDDEAIEQVTFGQILKLKEKQLEQEQEAGAFSFAAAFAALQTSPTGLMLSIPDIATNQEMTEVVGSKISTDSFPKIATDPIETSNQVSIIDAGTTIPGTTKATNSLLNAISNLVNENTAQEVPAKIELPGTVSPTFSIEATTIAAKTPSTTNVSVRSIDTPSTSRITTATSGMEEEKDSVTLPRFDFEAVRSTTTITAGTQVPTAPIGGTKLFQQALNTQLPVQIDVKEEINTGTQTAPPKIENPGFQSQASSVRSFVPEITASEKNNSAPDSAAAKVAVMTGQVEPSQRENDFPYRDVEQFPSDSTIPETSTVSQSIEMNDVHLEDSEDKADLSNINSDFSQTKSIKNIATDEASTEDNSTGLTLPIKTTENLPTQNTLIETEKGSSASAFSSGATDAYETVNFEDRAALRTENQGLNSTLSVHATDWESKSHTASGSLEPAAGESVPSEPNLQNAIQNDDSRSEVETLESDPVDVSNHLSFQRDAHIQADYSSAPVSYYSSSIEQPDYNGNPTSKLTKPQNQEPVLPNKSDEIGQTGDLTDFLAFESVVDKTVLGDLSVSNMQADQTADLAASGELKLNSPQQVSMSIQSDNDHSMDKRWTATTRVEQSSIELGEFVQNTRISSKGESAESITGKVTDQPKHALDVPSNTNANNRAEIDQQGNNIFETDYRLSNPDPGEPLMVSGSMKPVAAFTQATARLEIESEALVSAPKDLSQDVARKSEMKKTLAFEMLGMSDKEEKSSSQDISAAETSETIVGTEDPSMARFFPAVVKSVETKNSEIKSYGETPGNVFKQVVTTSGMLGEEKSSSMAISNEPFESVLPKTTFNEDTEVPAVQLESKTMTEALGDAVSEPEINKANQAKDHGDSTDIEMPINQSTQNGSEPSQGINRKSNGDAKLTALNPPVDEPSEKTDARNTESTIEAGTVVNQGTGVIEIAGDQVIAVPSRSHSVEEPGGTGRAEPTSKDEKAPPVEKQLKVNQTPGSVTTANDPVDEPTFEHNGKSPSNGFHAEAKEVVQQVIRHINSHLRNGPTSMHLQLNPNDLGTIDVQMVSDLHGVHVTFFAEQASTGKLLETQLDQLRTSLMDSGVHLSGLDIGQHNQSGQKGGRFEQSPNFTREFSPNFSKVQQGNQKSSRFERSLGQSSDIDYLI